MYFNCIQKYLLTFDSLAVVEELGRGLHGTEAVVSQEDDASRLQPPLGTFRTQSAIL